MYGSDDEVFELLAVSNSLPSEHVFHDGEDDVLDVVGGVLDDDVSEEEDDSDILEAVGGEEESGSFPFNSISDLEGGLVLVALVEHLSSLFHQSEDLNLEVHVGLLNEGIVTPLRAWSLASISGLMVSRTLAVHWSSLAIALSLSRGLAAKRTTKRVAKMIAFIV